MCNKSLYVSPSIHLLQCIAVNFPAIRTFLSFSCQIFFNCLFFPIIVLWVIINVRRIIRNISSLSLIADVPISSEFLLAVKFHIGYLIGIIVCVLVTIMRLGIKKPLYTSVLFVPFISVASSPLRFKCSWHFNIIEAKPNSFLILVTDKFYKIVL